MYVCTSSSKQIRTRQIKTFAFKRNYHQKIKYHTEKNNKILWEKVWFIMEMEKFGIKGIFLLSHIAFWVVLEKKNMYTISPIARRNFFTFLCQSKIQSSWSLFKLLRTGRMKWGIVHTIQYNKIQYNVCTIYFFPALQKKNGFIGKGISSSVS